MKKNVRLSGKPQPQAGCPLPGDGEACELEPASLPDLQQQELRLLFVRLDGWKAYRNQITILTVHTLSDHGFTVFRLVPVNSPVGKKVIQAVRDHRSPAEIAALHRNPIKRPEIEKCASVCLPDYLRDYLSEVLNDLRLLDQKIENLEQDILDKIDDFKLGEQIDLMCTVPAVTHLLAMRIIAELGVDYYRRYPSAQAFAKAAGLIPGRKRRASTGRTRLKSLLLPAAKAYVLRGACPLSSWLDTFPGQSGSIRAISVMSRRIAEGLWWVMARQEPYQYWQPEPVEVYLPELRFGTHPASPETGVVLPETHQNEPRLGD